MDQHPVREAAIRITRLLVAVGPLIRRADALQGQARMRRPAVRHSSQLPSRPADSGYSEHGAPAATLPHKVTEGAP